MDPRVDRASTPMTAPIPTTPHRTVRFQLDDTADDYGRLSTEDQGWADREDFMFSEDEDYDERRRSHDEDDDAEGPSSAPLLTRLEAPAVTVAMDQAAADLIEGRERPLSGMGMAFFNMSNSIIGAGIIGQPYAFRQAGLGVGLILLVTLTVVVNWTINLIVINSKLSGANSFQATVSACFGKPGLIAISIAQWAFAYGGMVAFYIIIGDSIPHVMAGFFPNLEHIPVLGLLTNRRAVIVICTICISFPLSLYRDISKLAKASAFALLSMFVIIFAILTQGKYAPEESKGRKDMPVWFLNGGIFHAIGVISFDHNSLLIYGSLRKPTLDRFAKVTNYSTGISLVACLAVALGGFLTFGDKTEGNVLNNFPADNTVVNIARLCFGLNMLTTLPLESFVCREVMVLYFFPHHHVNTLLHIALTSSLVFSAMLISLTICDLGAVFEIIGATSACALAYILPPLCYIKLAKRSWRVVPAVVTVVLGTGVMGISLVMGVGKMLGFGAGGGGERKVCS
ncbi:transmembrane amino acid transporter protein-domain-containing protein [Peziza echinospora]|nr:transmembrane amino acid transporter protein-domain-containing protein [Peziza echinospora]